MKNVSNDPNSIDIEKFGQPVFPSVSNPNENSLDINPSDSPRFVFNSLFALRF